MYSVSNLCEDADVSQPSNQAVPSSRQIDQLAAAVRTVMREMLIVGRAGQPAEGLLPFNPLYFHFLGELLDHGNLRPSELATRLGVARSTLSTASRALQSRQLIRQHPDPIDGRARQLGLTPKGKKTAEAIRRQDRENMRLLLSQVTTGQRRQMVDVMETVAAKLSGESDPHEA